MDLAPGGESLFFFFFLIYFWLCWVFVVACAGLSLVVASGGYSLVAVLRLPIVVASLVAKHSL